MGPQPPQSPRSTSRGGVGGEAQTLRLDATIPELDTQLGGFNHPTLEVPSTPTAGSGGMGVGLNRPSTARTPANSRKSPSARELSILDSIRADATRLFRQRLAPKRGEPTYGNRDGFYDADGTGGGGGGGGGGGHRGDDDTHVDGGSFAKAAEAAMRDGNQLMSVEGVKGTLQGKLTKLARRERAKLKTRSPPRGRLAAATAGGGGAAGTGGFRSLTGSFSTAKGGGRPATSGGVMGAAMTASRTAGVGGPGPGSWGGFGGTGPGRGRSSSSTLFATNTSRTSRTSHQGGLVSGRPGTSGSAGDRPAGCFIDRGAATPTT